MLLGASSASAILNVFRCMYLAQISDSGGEESKVMLPEDSGSTAFSTFLLQCWSFNPVPVLAKQALGSTSPVLTHLIKIFILRQSLPTLPRLASVLLCSPGRLQTFSLPASTSQVPELEVCAQCSAYRSIERTKQTP